MGSYEYGNWRANMEEAGFSTYLDMVEDGAMILEPKETFGKAVIGYLREDNKLVYSHDKIVEALMEDEGWSLEESLDWVSYNTIRSCQYYENAPEIVFEDEDIH